MIPVLNPTGKAHVDVTSSAGVFDSEGKLVRTLWSAQVNDINDTQAFDLTSAWDGRLDDLSTAAAGTYTVKLLQHRIKYTWEGVIGNTSPDHIENLDYHDPGTNINDMCITDGSHSPAGVGTEIYFVDAYNERLPTTHVTTENNIQQAKYVQQVQFRQSYGGMTAVTTDSIYVYIARVGDGSVFAMDCSTGQRADNAGFKSKVTFAFGVTPPSGSAPPHADDLNSEIGIGTLQYIYDISVQKSGSFLFLSRIEVGGPTPQFAIWTLDKTTGETLQHNASLGYKTQRAIAANPVSGELWVIHSSGAEGAPKDTITKLTADVGGTLTEAGVAITGLSDALSLEVSPDGATLLVIDGGASQQIKAFNTSDGSVKAAFGTSGVFGTAGGYVGSPAVTDTKWMFTSPNIGFSGAQTGFICFSSDGSWWIGDLGNYRYLHFSAGNSPTLLEQFAYIPGFYSAREVRGDPTRIIANYLEFKIDYSKPLAPNNGSWTLANNWGAGLPLDGSGNPTYDAYSSLKWVGVYSNGRTYCMLRSTTLGWQPAELTDNSGLRLIAKAVTRQNNFFVDHDMNLWFIQSNTGAGDVVNVQKNPFTGFDVSNNPTWQYVAEDPAGIYVSPFVAWPIVLTTETLPDGFPIIECQTNFSTPVMEPLSNGVLPFFNPHAYSSPGVPYATQNHLGGIDSVTGEAMFSVFPATPKNNGQTTGFLTYPEAPYFSTAYDPVPPGSSNGAGDYGGGSMHYLPDTSDIFTCYRGESWGGNQTNVWYHWHESGLLLGQFGAVAPYFGLQILTGPKLRVAETDYTNLIQLGDPSTLPISGPSSFKGMIGLAGNCLSGGLTFVNGKYYLHHNDEWYHDGIHRWRVDGVDSLQITTQTVSWGGAYIPPAPNEYNLLEGLPYNSSSVPDNTAGWTRSPTTNIGAHYPADSPFFDVTTNLVASSPFKTPDLCFRVILRDGTTATMSRTIPRHNSGNWSINGTIIYPQSNTNPGLHILVLDGAGKTIAKLYNSFNEASSLPNFWVNTAATNSPPWTHGIASPANSVSWQQYTGDTLPLVIRGNVETGLLTVTYGKYTISNVAMYDLTADVTTPAVFQIKADGNFQLPNGAAGYMDFITLDFVE